MVTHDICHLCNDSGTLRDGTPCPACSVSRRRELGSPIGITRQKRTVWIRSQGHDISRERSVFVSTGKDK